MNEIIIVRPAPPNGEIKGCWYNGYPVHHGHSEHSLNYATLHAKENGIIPDQKELNKEWGNFAQTLKNAGLKIHILDFPEELNQPSNLHHDAVFVRDSGFMFKQYWIKARFSADRSPEADAHAKTISKKFNKQIIRLPKDAYLEFGEVFYLETKDGSFYFGGLSRSNHKGHDFVKEIIKPDHYILLKSEGYHLDTVFTPILTPGNKLKALLIVKNMFSENSLADLEKLSEKFSIEIIDLDPIDSSGEGETLGNYAVNTLIAPGILVHCHRFLTEGIEEKLEKWGVKHYVTPLNSFKYAGGSCHCLTNEIYT